MPRFYFHLTDGKHVLNNHKGIDLSGNAAAREDALALARDLKHGAVDAGLELDRVVRRHRGPARAQGRRRAYRGRMNAHLRRGHHNHRSQYLWCGAARVRIVAAET